MSVLSDRNKAKTHCVNGHAFTPENVRMYRGRRYCRECARFHGRQYVRRVKPRHRNSPEYMKAYMARRYQMIKAGTWKFREKKKKVSITRQILDVLVVDGGWLTLEGITLQVKAHPKSVWRTLYRMHDRGQISQRRVELASGLNRSLQVRIEWRALARPDDLE